MTGPRRVSPGCQIWDGQSWHEAGRALGREKGAAHGDRGWLLHLLIPLSLTATALDRDTTGSRHTLVLSLFHHSAGECCNLYNDINLSLRKHTQLHSAPHHGPTGSWRVSTVVDEGIPTPATTSVPCHGPRGSWKGTRATDKGSSTLYPPFLCETSLVSNLLTNMQGKSGIQLVKKTSPELHQHYLS